MKNDSATITKATNNPNWILMDAKEETLGRLCSKISNILQGKNKIDYAKNINNGDFVIVINTDKIKVTGKKLTDKKYYHYSGYHGGMKEQSFEDLLEIDSTKIIKIAVSGMLPKNSLRKKLLSRLKIYSGPEHPHSAQINTK
jgi:large subunit ribosomal protein L13